MSDIFRGGGGWDNEEASSFLILNLSHFARRFLSAKRDHGISRFVIDDALLLGVNFVILCSHGTVCRIRDDDDGLRPIDSRPSFKRIMQSSDPTVTVINKIVLLAVLFLNDDVDPRRRRICGLLIL